MEKPDVDLIEGCRRRSRSSRRRRRTIRGRPSARSPRSTTTCACCTRASAIVLPDHPDQKLTSMTISQMVDASSRCRPTPSSSPRADHRQPEGRARRAVRRASRAGLRARASRRRRARDRRGAETRQDDQAHDRGRRRSPARVARVRNASPSRTRPRCARRRPRDRGRDRQRVRGRGSTVQLEVRVPDLQLRAAELEPRLFSFNPGGARAATASDRSASSIPSVVAFRSSRSRRARSRLGPPQPVLLPECSRSRSGGFDLERPFSKLTERVQSLVLNGSGDEDPVHLPVERGRPLCASTFEGILPNLERRYRETDSMMARGPEDLNSKPCPECHGTRLKREARTASRPTERSARSTRSPRGRSRRQSTFFAELTLEGSRPRSPTRSSRRSCRASSS